MAENQVQGIIMSILTEAKYSALLTKMAPEEVAVCAILLQVAEVRRAKSRDLLPFAQVIARSYSPEKKQEVLVMVWQVIYADNRLEPTRPTAAKHTRGRS